jgi:hypothetical protein
MAKRYLAGIPHDHAEADDHERIIGRHGHLGQIIERITPAAEELHADKQHQQNQGKKKSFHYQNAFNPAASFEPNRP